MRNGLLAARRGGASGFSLIELMSAVLLLGIAVSAIGPNIARLASKHRVHDGTRQIQTALQLARMKAVNERVDTVLLFTARGWNTFTDTNGNGMRDTGERWGTVLPTSLPPSISYRQPDTSPAGTSSLATGGCKCIRFRPNGTMVVSSSSTVSQFLAIGDGQEYRRLNVSTAGAVRVQRWNGTRRSWE